MSSSYNNSDSSRFHNQTYKSNTGHSHNGLNSSSVKPTTVLSKNDTTAIGVIPEFDTGEICWLLICTCTCWLMIVGVGLLYNGMGSKKNGLSVSMLCLWSCAIVSFQWYLFGGSLVMSRTGGSFIGNFDHIFLMNIGAKPSLANPKVPDLLVGVVFCLFAAITPTVIIGAVAERARFLPYAVFIFLWTTLVFDFVMYWEWNENGWIAKRGGLDFGGGSIVHVTTGFSSLAYAFLLGKRKVINTVPHNMAHVILGTGLIWYAWLIANAVSGLSANLRTVSVLISTNLSASVGGITWTILDYRYERKYSPMAFVSGVIAGLVMITPASGLVSPASSVLFGIIGPLFCSLTVGCKRYLRIDDAFDVFGVHGAGGVLGGILTGVFAEKSIAALDGSISDGGAVYDGNWIQIVKQLDVFACAAWSFFVTLILVFIIDKIPGLKLRASSEEEFIGLDNSELGMVIYQYMEREPLLEMPSEVISVTSNSGKDDEGQLENKMVKNNSVGILDDISDTQISHIQATFHY